MYLTCLLYGLSFCRLCQRRPLRKAFPYLRLLLLRTMGFLNINSRVMVRDMFLLNNNKDMVRGMLLNNSSRCLMYPRCDSRWR